MMLEICPAHPGTLHVIDPMLEHIPSDELRELLRVFVLASVLHISGMTIEELLRRLTLQEDWE